MQRTPIVASPVVKMRLHPAAHPHYPIQLVWKYRLRVLCVWRRCFCQLTLAPFYVLRFSCRLFHFAADIVTRSYTKMTIYFPCS